MESHYYYISHNAVAKIEIPENILPHNVTVDVNQSSEYYTIHVVSFANTDHQQDELYQFSSQLPLILADYDMIGPNFDQNSSTEDSSNESQSKYGDVESFDRFTLYN